MGGFGRPGYDVCQRSDITVQLIDFPPGPVRALYARRGGTRAVLVDRALCAAERRAAVTHELVHAERGQVPRDAPGWMVAKEERQVDSITAQRLLPQAELRRFVEARTDVGPVCAADVAEHFEVPLPVAVHACDELVRARASARAG